MDQRPVEDPGVPSSPPTPTPAPPPPPPLVQPLPPPVGPPVTASTQQAAQRAVAEPIAGRARFASIAIWLNVAATVLATVALWRDRVLLIDIRDGVFVSDAQIDSVDRLGLIAAVTYLLTLIVAIVAFVRWFALAYRNLATWTRTKHTTGWAIGAWFVPFLNLWRPFKIAEEIAIGSHDPRHVTRPRMVTVWWSMFVLSNTIDRGIFRQDPTTIEAFITQNTLGFVSNAVWVVAGAAALSVIRTITADQEARVRAAGATA